MEIPYGHFGTINQPPLLRSNNPRSPDVMQGVRCVYRNYHFFSLSTAITWSDCYNWRTKHC